MFKRILVPVDGSPTVQHELGLVVFDHTYRRLEVGRNNQ